MGTFPLNKRNCKRIGKMLEAQMDNAQKRFANEAYFFLTHFDYSLDGGSENEGQGGGYTLYYVSNWNVSIGKVDESVKPKERVLEEERYRGNIDYGKADNKFTLRKNNIKDTLYVTNSVYYGKTLNSGGYFENAICAPNRFIERCQAHLINMKDQLLKGIDKDAPDL